MDALPQYIPLKEQSFCPAVLTREDLGCLSELKFQVTFQLNGGGHEAEGRVSCQINPNSYVGHFQLPSGRIIVIEPKVDTASIFRMLAYVFTTDHRRLFREQDVNYTDDRLMFEPLVELFNAMVSARARRGLVQDYIRREENLGSFRGALNISAHIQQNFGRDNRIHCRFFEQTVDIPDNRLVKTTLHQLLQFGGWTTRTTQSLIRNLHQFDAVMLERSPRGAVVNSQYHYHRLNDDYRPIHDLCHMFLAYASISERVGTFGFKGFLLDMNRLYEQFVQRAFQTVLSRSTLRLEIQQSRRLSINPAAPNIRPDVTVRDDTEVVVIADAKYKKDFASPPNTDLYQVIAYGTVLKCRDVFLLYPQTEIETDHDIEVLNSDIVVKTRCVDISSPKAVEVTESLARAVVSREHPVMRDFVA
jgi:5-methylcytosine-specific restriction enzyme subunit McrC